jgi:hypothetical protein
MSVTSNEQLGAEGTPTYLARSDPGQTVTDFESNTIAAEDYFPVWLNRLADDVTLEGAMMNGAVRGPEAVRALIGFVRTLYEDQQFSFAGPYGDDGFLEIYNSRVHDEPIGSVVLVSRNAAGETQHIVVNYRPRRSIILVSQLVGEPFAGTPLAQYFASGVGLILTKRRVVPMLPSGTVTFLFSDLEGSTRGSSATCRGRGRVLPSPFRTKLAR